MNLKKRILLCVLLLFLIFLSGVYSFLIFKGRVTIIEQLESLTSRKVTIGQFAIQAPINIEIKKFEIEGLVKADTIYVSPSFWGFLTGKTILNDVKIFNPEITLEKTVVSNEKSAVKEASSQDVSTFVTKVPALVSKMKRKPSFNVKINNLAVKNGSIVFHDKTIGESGIVISVREVDLKITNLSSKPKRGVFSTLEMRGKIPWAEGKDQGSIEAKGRVNFSKNDFEGVVKILGIDGVYLYPYYAQGLNLDKARIQSARLNFTSNLRAVNNNMTAECHLELVDIVFVARASDEAKPREEKIAAMIIDRFKAFDAQQKVVLDFTYRTKLDRPQFSFSNIKMALEDKVAVMRRNSINPLQVFLEPTKKLFKGMVKNAADISAAVKKGMSGIAQGFMKAAEVSSQKENK